jgi:pyruvate/2-oxoglutarate dehydrogenase complex dihydrolipoamide dehydrogenase (E3) component
MVDYDLVVIGGGAAGLAAARTGARRGARTLLVHDGPLGCVPSKTLIEAAKRRISYDEAHRRAQATVARIARTEDAVALSDEGIDVRRGRARFRTPGQIEVDGSRISAKRFVVATGSTRQVT